MEPILKHRRRCGITPPENIESDEMNIGQPVEYYNLLGVKIAEPKKGAVYLRKQGNKTEKIIMR